MNHWTRCCVAFLLIIALSAFSAGQDGLPAKKGLARFGFDADNLTYPQKTPKEAMNSIVKALDRKRVDYLLAQLSDPTYVDYWIDRYKQDIAAGKEEGRRLLAFDRLVRETGPILFERSADPSGSPRLR